jgi:type IV pilus assembly protein PilX
MKSISKSLNDQQGAALFVSLMMLILVTILGVTGVRLVSLEEKMAGNSYDRNLAFQSAEAALRVAEKYVEDYKPTPCYDDQTGCVSPIASSTPACTTNNRSNSLAINNCDDTTGVCPKIHQECFSRWEPTASFTKWVSITTSLGTLAGTAPEYFVEYLGGTFVCQRNNPTEIDFCVLNPGSPNRCDCKRYRITARSNPGTGRATVMLQSVYATN